MKPLAWLILTLAAAPLRAAIPEGAPPANPLLNRPIPSSRLPSRYWDENAERRRVKAAWSGTVVKRVEARAAGIVAETPASSKRAALQRFAKSLSKEADVLRADRAGAFEELMRAPKNSRAARAWRQAIEVDTVLLDEYPSAFAAIARFEDVR